ncbi:aspartic peptidase domain-containing protein [Globomyces pollinis-pini]|nr:aspartic peptidase domain-containing protein [Globomyces pollinis-pini]
MFLLVATTIVGVYGVQQSFEIEQPITPRLNPNLQGKVLAPVTGGFASCFLTRINAANNEYIVQLDTGSSDTALPHSSLNNYAGDSIKYDIGVNSTELRSSYADGSYWLGHEVEIPLGIHGTNLMGQSPVALMTKQSKTPVFTSGSPSQGLMGLAFPIISELHANPPTVMDAWFKNGQIKKNEIALHGCPYTMQSKSWIDFGNETPYTDCGGRSVTISIPFKSYFTLNVKSISISGSSQTLPKQFQAASKKFSAGYAWSILDSCTSVIVLPDSIVVDLQNKIKASGGFSKTITSEAYYFSAFLDAQGAIQISKDEINWNLLPSLSFVITSDLGDIELVIGPRQYIQYDTTGYINMLVVGGGDDFAVLGLPIFSAYHIVLDRLNGRVSFALGCGCNSSPDGYPKIIQKAKSTNNQNDEIVDTLTITPSISQTSKNQGTDTEPFSYLMQLLYITYVAIL